MTEVIRIAAPFGFAEIRKKVGRKGSKFPIGHPGGNPALTGEARDETGVGKKGRGADLLGKAQRACKASEARLKKGQDPGAGDRQFQGSPTEVYK